MSIWIMNLNITRNENETFIRRLTDPNKLNKEIELHPTVNAQNIDKIEIGDTVYLCFGGSSAQTKNIAVRGFYAIIEKTGYQDSKKDSTEKISSFKIIKCYGRKEKDINGMEHYTTYFPKYMFDEKFETYFNTWLRQAGKNSISIEKNPEFINKFINELDRLKLQIIAEIL